MIAAARTNAGSRYLINVFSSQGKERAQGALQILIQGPDETQDRPIYRNTYPSIS